MVQVKLDPWLYESLQKYMKTLCIDWCASQSSTSGVFPVKNGQDSRMGDTLLTWRDLQGLTFEFWQETGGMSII